jgi:hypothetical protein
MGMAYYNGTTINFTDLTETLYSEVNTGAGVVAVTFPAGADGAPPRNFYRVNVDLSGLGTTWVSGNIQYCVISTDSDHRGFTLL